MHFATCQVTALQEPHTLGQCIEINMFSSTCQVTALGQPHMLEAVSAALSAGRPPCELPDRQLALMNATVTRLAQLARAASKVAAACAPCGGNAR